ncbi:WXG100 family type VII secretion target [Streptosporangium canum]|uniref:WXG100 family type VII secretion target n=1 Tax=Streptosporangium canum TaxID=324952 RepID=A0A1I4FE49_9ACTN|nr:WXG100 family type VII secretion target [Streptosporangium canum]SFL16222.1 WXG100 family type VII secretion target [Streptosporangium canum]
MAEIKDIFDENSTHGRDADKIREASLQVADTAQFVDGLRRRVNDDTALLMTSGWLGPAAGKFKLAMEAWDTQALRIRQDLETIAENMGMNSVTYSQADDDVQQGMNRVDSLINAAIESKGPMPA